VQNAEFYYAKVGSNYIWCCAFERLLYTVVEYVRVLINLWLLPISPTFILILLLRCTNTLILILKHYYLARVCFVYV
jgi:type IV secretory pathway VirB6-like protein